MMMLNKYINIINNNNNINNNIRNNIIRLLSSQVVSKNNINSNNSKTPINKVVVVDSNNKLDFSTIGRYYQTLVHKGGQGALGLRDLKHLFEKCLEPDHLKYAIKAVEMYQKKGHDFSEEISSLFIRLCITAKNPKAAVDICSVYKYRLGAWLTPSSLGKLIESMSEKINSNGTIEDLGGLVNLITVSHAKAVPISKDNIKLVLQHTIKLSNLEMHTKLIETAKTALSTDDVNDLLKEYPAPVSVTITEEKAADDVTEAVEVAEDKK